MKFRILKIKGISTCKSLLLYINKDEHDVVFIELLAWHTSDDGDLIHQGRIEVSGTDNNELMTEKVLRDFSDASAHEFIKSFNG